MGQVMKTKTGRIAIHIIVCFHLALHGVNHIRFHWRGIKRELQK